MTLVVEMTLQRENSKVGLHWMHGVKKLNFMRPDPVMPSHLRSPSRPFLRCQIAKRYTQAQIQISVTAGVRVVHQVLGLMQRMSSRKVRLRNAK